jgi:segregation and condensation protein A
MITFKHGTFSGPLDLLLKLIEKEEMDITQISLAKIADQYINYIRSASNIKPEDMADFLVIAARLLLIKSKALFPYLLPEEDEEVEDLERQLKMYKEFIDAMKVIEKMLGKKKFMFNREFNRKIVLNSLNFFSPPKNMKSGDLEMIFNDLLGKIKSVPELEEEFIERTVSIEEKIIAIQDFISAVSHTNFSSILTDSNSKTDIIVSFLALLELIKQNNVTVSQDGLFGEIEIDRKENYDL